jgi:hypothetical protein
MKRSIVGVLACVLTQVASAVMAAHIVQDAIVSPPGTHYFTLATGGPPSRSDTTSQAGIPTGPVLSLVPGALGKLELASTLDTASLYAWAGAVGSAEPRFSSAAEGNFNEIPFRIDPDAGESINAPIDVTAFFELALYGMLDPQNPFVTSALIRDRQTNQFLANFTGESVSRSQVIHTFIGNRFLLDLDVHAYANPGTGDPGGRLLLGPNTADVLLQLSLSGTPPSLPPPMTPPPVPEPSTVALALIALSIGGKIWKSRRSPPGSGVPIQKTR